MVILDFLVVKVTLPYNAILERPGLNVLRAIISTYHLLVKFSTARGVGELRGNQAWLDTTMSPPSKERSLVDEEFDTKRFTDT